MPATGDATKWDVKTLKEVQPYYWVNALKGLDTGNESDRNT